jgi:hypothetical protein
MLDPPIFTQIWIFVSKINIWQPCRAGKGTLKVEKQLLAPPKCRRVLSNNETEIAFIRPTRTLDDVIEFFPRKQARLPKGSKNPAKIPIYDR